MMICEDTALLRGEAAVVHGPDNNEMQLTSGRSNGWPPAPS